MVRIVLFDSIVGCGLRLQEIALCLSPKIQNRTMLLPFVKNCYLSNDVFGFLANLTDWLCASNGPSVAIQLEDIPSLNQFCFVTC